MDWVWEKQPPVDVATTPQQPPAQADGTVEQEAAAAEHIQGLGAEGAQAAPPIIAALAQMEGAQDVQLPAAEGGVAQPPGDGVQQAPTA